MIKVVVFWVVTRPDYCVI